MKMTWSNILNLILILIIIVLLLGVLDTRKPVQVSEQILGFMQQQNARAALVLDDNGRATVINQNGEQIKECSVGPKGKFPQCKGLGPTGTVLDIKMHTIIRARGSNCMEFVDGDGFAFEVCW